MNVRKKLSKLADLFLIGGLIGSSKIMGRKAIYTMVLRMVWSYKRTIIYLLRKKGIKALLTFLYVKTLVPVGEGAGGAIYLLFGSLVRRFPQLAPYPKYTEVEVTTVCNLKCNMCEHTYWSDQEKRHLKFEEFKHIIDQFPKLRWINATGEGSGFLNRDYIKMIEYLKQKNVAVYFVDHFERLDGNIARKLIELGVDGIYASVDGATKETYEKIRIGADFDKVTKNLKTLVELKNEMNSPIPEICFRYTIQKLNLHEMPQFVEFVASLGTRKELGDGSRIDFGGLLDFKKIRHLCVEEIPEAIIRETLDKRKKLDLDVLFQHTGTKSIKIPNPPLELCLCWMEPYIMMGGYVLPCCQVLMSNKRTFLRKHAFGNVFETNFKDIWYSERYKKFRNTVNEENRSVPLFCAGCRGFETKNRIREYGIDGEL